ncbi:acyl-CoA dehydrogenase family protein [Caenimonas aquaedulcis]|uniref:Acyl-CoA dehydrogenase family protein n=1 Tax=Caenimonas aquaedulcis TaxID=2793270 RepID=A0A931MIX0_9BURK|nr:acyl-CoA dehydrogenase family protein [Caenimonas aquaedulcis]MBG9390467.1 acyl-CoA dehydrogenase family protein [Caenimonas aquaedulcis]
MDFNLTEEQTAILDLTRRFARERIKPHVREYDRDERFPLEIYEQMGPLGLTGGVIPEEYGGAGMDYQTYALMIMELASTCQVMACAASWASGVGGISVLRYGTEEQKKEFLVPLAQGRGPVAFALTETHTGSDVASMRTRAVRDGDHYVLNGTKVWISMVAKARWIITFATLDPAAGRKGITAFLLDPASAGISRSPFKNKVGFRPLESGELVLDNVRVPASSRLGAEGEGFKIAMSSVESGRLSVAARCVGMIGACLELATEYAKTRETFGQPIARRQLIQSKITDMRVAYETARLLVLQAAWKKDSGDRARADTSMAKLYASDALMRVAEDAMQIHGAYGCSDEYEIGRYWRDAKFMQTIEGSNEIHRGLVAEYELGYR